MAAALLDGNADATAEAGGHLVAGDALKFCQRITGSRLLEADHVRIMSLE